MILSYLQDIFRLFDHLDNVTSPWRSNIEQAALLSMNQKAGKAWHPLLSKQGRRDKAGKGGIY